MFDKVEKENYMGMISWSKASCGSANNFFGSEIKTDHPICLRICEGEHSREISKDWYFAHKEIIEVEMTPIQWAEFLTSCGNASGIPCTIRRRDGKMMDPVPQTKIFDQFEEEAAEHFDNFSTGADNLAKYVKDCLDSGKPMGKKQMEDLLRNINDYKHNTVSNLRYVKESFREQMSEIVVKAKAEVNAFVENKAVELGMEELRNGVKLAIDAPKGEES